MIRGLAFPSSIFHLPSSILCRAVQKITIIGVGLLGGSLGLAIRNRRLAVEVAGYVRRRASLKDCEQVGAVDCATTESVRGGIESRTRDSLHAAGTNASAREANASGV